MRRTRHDNELLLYYSPSELFEASAHRASKSVFRYTFHASLNSRPDAPRSSFRLSNFPGSFAQCLSLSRFLFLLSRDRQRGAVFMVNVRPGFRVERCRYNTSQPMSRFRDVIPESHDVCDLFNITVSRLRLAIPAREPNDPLPRRDANIHFRSSNLSREKDSRLVD